MLSPLHLGLPLGQVVAAVRVAAAHRLGDAEQEAEHRPEVVESEPVLVLHHVCMGERGRGGGRPVFRELLLVQKLLQLH